MQCPRCGEDQAAGARFCAACGQPLPDGAMLDFEPAKPPVILPDDAGQPHGGEPRPMAPGVQPPPISAADSSGAQRRIRQRQRPFARRGVLTRAGNVVYSPVVPTTLCRVCGAGVALPARACATCGTPPGMIVNPDDPFAGSYLLPAAPGVSPGAQSVPVFDAAWQGRARWNWGAAFLTYPWAVAHRIWWYVALQTVLIGAMVFAGSVFNSAQASTVVNGILDVELAVWLPLRLYFGLRGTRLAGQARRFESSDHCLYVQEVWRPFGIVAGLLELMILAGAALLSIMMKGMT